MQQKEITTEFYYELKSVSQDKSLEIVANIEETDKGYTWSIYENSNLESELTNPARVSFRIFPTEQDAYANLMAKEITKYLEIYETIENEYASWDF